MQLQSVPSRKFPLICGHVIIAVKPDTVRADARKLVNLPRMSPKLKWLGMKGILAVGKMIEAELIQS